MHTLNTLRKYTIVFALASMTLAHPAAPAADISHEKLTEVDILLAECRKEPGTANAPLFDRTLNAITQDWFFRTDSMAAVLRSAARNGHEYFVQQLLQYGVPVDASNKHNQTALHRAAQSGHATIVKTLLAAGADHTALAKQEIETLEKTDKKEYRDISALRYAVQGNHPEAFELLAAREAPENANVYQQELHEAALYGHLEIVRILLDKYNANVDYQDSEQDTALHSALVCSERAENRAVIDFLLSRNANPNILDNFDRSALCIAIEHANTIKVQAYATVELLLLHGVPPPSKGEIILLRPTTGDLTAILKGPVKSAQDQIDHANALLASHIARDNKNHLLNFLPHDVCGEVVEYALTPGVYREYEREKQARTAAKANVNAGSDDGNNQNNNDDGKIANS